MTEGEAATEPDTRMREKTGQARDAVPAGKTGKLGFSADPNLAPGLYIVATPIGNLRDITLRALDILASADLICAEDTRVTGKLLSAYGISTPLRPYHDHSRANDRAEIVRLLQDGGRIALVSDAGTPLISDPGFKLVRDLRQAGIAVYSIPGASSALAALTSAGLPTDRFQFLGFPPQKGGARRTFLEDVRSIPSTLVFFEGASRLGASLADMADMLGDREAAVARELTKKFEEIRTGRLSELAATYADQPPKGEVVVVVGPPEQVETSRESLDAMIEAAGDERPLKEIAAEIADALGLRRREVYERALELRGK